MIVSQEERLHDAQTASGEVQEDVSDAPALSALPLVVHDGLGEVLDERDEELDVGAQVEELQPVDHRGQGQDHGDGEEDEDPEDDQLAYPRDGLVRPLQ